MSQLSDTTGLDGLTARLATWVAGVRYADVPSAARQTAVECVLDSIGVGVVGASLPINAKLQRLLDLEGRGTPSTTVIGSATRASATWAAFVNGCLMHAEDWDDTPHTSYYLPSLLATAEELDASGEALITAWVVAYEVWARLVPALAMDRQHNPTSVIASMAGSLGVGWLRHFGVDDLRTVLAIGAANSAGLRANFGTLAKPMDAGTANRASILAAELTTVGWTAERQILEGLEGVRYKGVFDSFGGAKRDPARLLDGLGADFKSAARPRTGFGGGALDGDTWPPRWTADDARQNDAGGNAMESRGAPTIKAWPACFGHNSTLTALFSLIDEPGFDRAQIESIEVLRPTEPTDSATFRTEPRTGLEAKFSTPFVVAAAWLDGTIDVDTFRPDNFRRICQSGLMQRVRIVVDPSLGGRGSVVLHVKNGNRHEFPIGRGLALHDTGVVAKFVHNTAPLLGVPDATRIADRVMNVERESGTRELIASFAVDMQPRWESE